MHIANNGADRIEADVPFSHWEVQAPSCKKDLIIKKVAVTILAAANFILLSSSLYYVILYTPIPTRAILVSPFIVGVLGALAYLKFPTCGISSNNYSSYLNPTYMIGRLTAYVFFGPLMYALDKIDWTPYHDPIRANKISHELEKLPFDKLCESYGNKFDNLVKYGFIHRKYQDELKELHAMQKPIKKAIDFWQREDEDSEELKEAKEAQQEINAKWQELKDRFQYPFPHPKKPVFDFTKRTTSIKLQLRSTCFGTPIDVLRRF